MGLLDSIKSFFAPQGRSDDWAMWLYVRCKRCGAPLAVRVDLRNEPSSDYESGGYVLNKEMMDSKCFALMRATVHFDAQRKVVSQSIENGDFITAEEYERQLGN
ncbi:MAG: hypothetical protein HY782_05290 [Chloroflexi bacterium]|nr:hypothetical protein [Chloroflexota bacterium]